MILSAQALPRAAGQPYPRRGRSARRVVAFTLLLALALLAPAAEAADRAPRPLRPCGEGVEPPLSVIHFFDWYAAETINGPRWTHQVDWAGYGLGSDEVGRSKRYYDVQLDLVDGLGVDGIVYEYYRPGLGAGEMSLSPSFLASLREHRVKVGLFYDLELEQVWTIGPVLSDVGYIRPTQAEAQALVAKLAGFYERLPRDSWLVDGRGRLPMMVFGFGFDQASTDAAAWDRFYRTILDGVQARLGLQPVIYWTAVNRLQLEVAFQRFPEQIRPFNFVVDSPQPQLAPGAVTWNVNFDNLGVQRAYGLLRVIRDDPRYLQEMLWLAKHTAPELLFIYGWNEFYEGANVMPDRTYGTSRYELVKALLADVERDGAARLPCTLLVVDDYSDFWQSGDWHLQVEEQFTLYPLRRLAPQADVLLASEVTPELLAGYDLILMLAQASPQALEHATRAMDEKRVVFFGPAAASSKAVRTRFAAGLERRTVNADVQLVGRNGRSQGTLFVRDDVLSLRPARGVVTGSRIVAGGLTAPVLLRRGDDWWLNAFSPDDRLLAPLFAGVYGRPLEPGIMYGEGLRSQRLQITADGRVTQNTFEAPAVFQHEPLPVPWRPPPPELPR